MFCYRGALKVSESVPSYAISAVLHLSQNATATSQATVGWIGEISWLLRQVATCRDDALDGS